MHHTQNPAAITFTLGLIPQHPLTSKWSSFGTFLAFSGIQVANMVFAPE